jgi:hypothetical protein
MTELTSEALGGLTCDEMRKLLRDLQEARFSGALRVRFRERDVTFQSDAEMARKESELTRRISTQCMGSGQGNRRKHVGLVTFGRGT